MKNPQQYRGQPEDTTVIDLNPFKNPNTQYEYKDRHNDKKSLAGFIVWGTMFGSMFWFYTFIVS